MSRYYTKASRIVIGLAAAAMLLAACSNGSKNATSGSAAEVQGAGTTTAGGAQSNGAGPSEEAGSAGTDEAASVEAGASAEAGNGKAANIKAEPIASLPDKNIYLYPVSDKPDGGVILQAGEHEQRFDWIYDTPRMIMPQLQMSDYDGDGEEELAAITYVGSGTGISIYELHMVEGIAVDDKSVPPYIDNVFDSPDYLAQLDQAIAFKKVMKDGELFGQITVGGQKHEVSLADFQKEYGEDKIDNRLGFGAIIQYSFKNGALALEAAVGLMIDGVAEPQYIGSVTAAVTYKSGKFKIEQFGFTTEV